MKVIIENPVLFEADDVSNLSMLIEFNMIIQMVIESKNKNELVRKINDLSICYFEYGFNKSGFWTKQKRQGIVLNEIIILSLIQEDDIMELGKKLGSVYIKYIQKLQEENN